MVYVSEGKKKITIIDRKPLTLFSTVRENLKSVLLDKFMKPFFGKQSFPSCHSSHTVPVALLSPVVPPQTQTAASARAGIVSMRELEC